MNDHVNAIRPRTVARLALLLPLLAALSLFVPRGVRGAETDLPGTEARKCADRAWAEYNACLMEADNWFDRKVCDIAFQADVVYCGARYAGIVREAASPQS